MSDRWYFVALVLAYLAAGAILAFGCFVLLNAADQINSSNLCRRI
jgi:hypothetical protein